MPKIVKIKDIQNPSDVAGDILDHVLHETSEITQREKKSEGTVANELKSKSVIDSESKRIQSRVLFITRDANVLESNSTAQNYLKNLEEMFDEVHIIVLGLSKRNITIKRVSSKVWIYPTASKYFLQQPFKAYSIAKKQLQFTDGFRPDIVVAMDVFESGIAGYFIAKHFNRELQLHLTEDFYNSSFKSDEKHNAKRLRFSKFLLKRAKNVLVSTDTLKYHIDKKYPKIKNISLLPRFFNLAETLSKSKIPQIKKIYSQFAFVILFVGTLDNRSTLFRSIDSARVILRTPSIGLVVIGDGPNKKEFQTRAKLLGIDTQIIFTSKVSDIVEHMQSSDLLICTDTNSESEETVITAAAAGLPMLIAKTELRNDLFTDGVDSFLCEPEDTQEFAGKLVKFLNKNVLRLQFSINAREVVSTRIEESPTMYRRTIRDLIEEVIHKAEDE